MTEKYLVTLKDGSTTIATADALTTFLSVITTRQRIAKWEKI